MSAVLAVHYPPLIRKFSKELLPKPRIAESDLIKFLEKPEPLFIEIGCGAGLHPTNWAQLNPNAKLVAIERTKEKFRKFENRYRENGSPANLCPLHAHAVSVIAHYVEDKSVEEYFILFPNPEIKNPQQRWIRMPFFSEIIRTLKSGGKIHFATNEKFYADEIEEYAKKAWGLHSKSSIFSGPSRTHFEKKYRERGDTIYSVTLMNP